MSEAPTRRPGLGQVPLPEGSKVVDIIVFKGRLLVALDTGVYIEKDGVFVPVPFAPNETPGAVEV